MVVERCDHYTKLAALLLGDCYPSHMEDLGLEALSRLAKLHGHDPYGVAFSWNPLERTGGGYAPKHDVIYVNLAHLRTARDVVFVLAHEYAHLLQQRKYGVEVMVKSATNMGKLSEGKDVEAAFYAYLQTDTEKEADAFAFAFEDSFHYDNQVLNRRPLVSFFVSRKHSIAFAPK